MNKRVTRSLRRRSTVAKSMATKANYDLGVRRWVTKELNAGLRARTMLGQHDLIDLVKHVDLSNADGIEGAFVECGVWRGGAAILGARRFKFQGDERRTWLF